MRGGQELMLNYKTGRREERRARGHVGQKIEMSLLGQKRTLWQLIIDVRFTP
jgi:hypothetical protein